MINSYYSANNKMCLCTLLLLGVFYSTVLKAQNTQVAQRKKVDSVALYIGIGKTDSLSQTERMDALLKGLQYAEKIKEDTAKSKAFSQISYAFFGQGDSLFFRQTNRTTILLAKQARDSIALAEAYWDLGAFYQRISVPDSAYYSFFQAQQLYEAKNNPSLSGRMFLNMATQQEAIKDYVGSEANLILGIQRLKSLNDFRQLSACYNLLGVITKDLGDYDKAIEYYNEASFYTKKLDANGSLLLNIKNNLGVVYQRKKDFTSAIDNFKAILSADRIKIKDAQLYSIALNNLAFSKMQLKDTFGVKNLIQESIRIKDSLGLKTTTSYCYMSLAEYYWLKNDTLASISTALKSRTIALESSDNEQLLETLEFLTKIDTENASKHALTYYTLNHRLQNEERQTRNKFARIRFETDEFIAKNGVLSKEKQVLSRQKQIWAAVAVGFFLLGLAVYIIINQRSKNQKLVFQQQQQANNQETFNLMLAQKQKVDEVKRMEQKRISEELHDGVLGKMLGARMVLTGLNKKADTGAIQERSGAIVALKNIESELRAISHELSHTAYQKINNFVNSIEALLESAKDKPMNTIFN
ncbi:MAG: two-component system NarL family sensor kinase, partial [Maribacter sp.]